MTANAKMVIEHFSKHDGLFSFSRLDFINNPPDSPGIYAFYFDKMPYNGLKGLENCVRVEKWTLLYVGISPGDETKKGTIQQRIGSHFGGAIAGLSTLRLSLGCMLSYGKDLDITLKCSGGKETFGPNGEQKLTDWMKEHAQVCWFVIEKPWLVEKEVIQTLQPPINIEHNETHPFCGVLRAIRKECKDKARALSNAKTPEKVAVSSQPVQCTAEAGTLLKEYGKRDEPLYRISEKDGNLTVMVYTRNASFLDFIRRYTDRPSALYAYFLPDKERYERFKRGGNMAVDQINSMAKSYLGVIALLDYPEYFKNGKVIFKLPDEQPLENA